MAEEKQGGTGAGFGITETAKVDSQPAAQSSDAVIEKHIARYIDLDDSLQRQFEISWTEENELVNIKSPYDAEHSIARLS
ncbi:MAG: hypothetical protein QMD85_03045 [Candidatus Aenigmarchaeota archaeon]|nr:hypothetical protein [Candidatus Aenigmarchaeota archaeon]